MGFGEVSIVAVLILGIPMVLDRLIDQAHGP